MESISEKKRLEMGMLNYQNMLKNICQKIKYNSTTKLEIKQKKVILDFGRHLKISIKQTCKLKNLNIGNGRNGSNKGSR